MTSKVGRGGQPNLPWVFTEHGVAMLSSVLRSPTAARVNVEIMRAFVRLRRLLATPGELVEQIAKLGETVQLHDDQIKTIAQVLRQMMETASRNVERQDRLPKSGGEMSRQRTATAFPVRTDSHSLWHNTSASRASLAAQQVRRLARAHPIGRRVDLGRERRPAGRRRSAAETPCRRPPSAASAAPPSNTNVAFSR